MNATCAAAMGRSEKQGITAHAPRLPSGQALFCDQRESRERKDGIGGALNIRNRSGMTLLIMLGGSNSPGELTGREREYYVHLVGVNTYRDDMSR